VAFQKRQTQIERAGTASWGVELAKPSCPCPQKEIRRDLYITL